MKRVFHIVYFSGTGGTKLSAHTLSDELLKKGVNARCSEIFRDDVPEILPEEEIILMYPVYAADAPIPVYEWIASLKKKEAGKAAIISVSGGGEISPNTACRVKSIKRLKKKGYKVENDYMLCMPSNFIEPTDNETAVKLIQVLPKKCALIAEELVENKKNTKKPILIDKILRPLFSAEKFGSKFFGKMLKADEKCNSCGLCALKCPCGNIEMIDGIPKFGWKCVICMRCVYSCPQTAIKSRMPILKKAIFKQGFDLEIIQGQAENQPNQFNDDSPKGALWKGIRIYLEDENNI